MRGWNKMFRFDELKTRLNSQVKSKAEFSVIRKKYGIASRVNKNEAGFVAFEEVPLKTTYMM